ncbi:MAG: trimethylamine methyltransferase family protein [Synergistes jonesii]|uniref:trimethylamine methyltransferase family protein n=1 Tax=Synergistes jonesii TaxID=2754 RepID=UPI002A748144|nr:trimethylamine methyltransferase family protein [Synergistes jonesii]MDY2985516.1 trimethylamine methyltransferase family protein [Synergistes jonesii]
MSKFRRANKEVEKKIYEGKLYRPLTEEQMQMIHEASLKIFEEIGVCIKYASAREYWRKAGAVVDDVTGVCKVGREIVEECIKRAPGEFTQYGRVAKNNIQQGPYRFYGGPSAEAVGIWDFETGEHRAPNIYDLAAGIRICDALENCDLIQSCCFPSELSKDAPDLNRYFIMTKNSSKHICTGPYHPGSVPKIYKMANIILGKEDAFRERPFITLVCGVISPFIMDAKWTETLLLGIDHGFPIASPTASTVGTTCPGTLAAQLVLSNVEALMTVITTQLKKPGHPCFYSAVPMTVDHRDGAFCFASVEGWMQNCAINQLAQWYDIPNYSICGMCDSKVMDTQLGIEMGMGIVLGAMSGSNNMHGSFGLLEGGLTLCLENFVVANEVVGMSKRVLQGIEVDAERLALDSFRNVGIGGVFLDDPLTTKYTRSEFYYPKLADRKTFASWDAAGRPAYNEKARKMTMDILMNHKAEQIDPEAEAEIRATFPEILPDAGKTWLEK